MWDAIKRNDKQVIELKLVQESFPVDTPITDTGLPALSFACSWTTDQEVFDLIMSRNPDVNFQSSGGKTPLHLSAINGNTVAMQNLMNHPDLDKNCQTFGLETPLMCAIRGGSVDALAVLLNNGANPFARNGLGQSALDISRTINSQHQ